MLKYKYVMILTAMYLNLRSSQPEPELGLKAYCGSLFTYNWAGTLRTEW